MFVTHDRDDRDIICFIGDSYAAAGSGVVTSWSSVWLPPWAHQEETTSTKPYVVYTDLIADKLNMRPLVLAFAATSWWQSRWAMLEFFRRNPEEKKYIKKIVATHTNPDRINSVRCDKATDYEELKNHKIYDIDFNVWSQKQWFLELSTKIFPGIPMINFSCFGWDLLPDTDLDDSVGYENLHGVIFLDSLVKITIGESTGNQAEIRDYTQRNIWYLGEHYCHFNEKNHRVMADILYENFMDYEPGHKYLPLDRFDCVNPYARYWPNGRYWTKD